MFLLHDLDFWYTYSRVDEEEGTAITIKDIAKAAGVSIATVSKVLNRRDEGITEETRAKVLEVVKENQYVPYAKIRDKFAVQRNVIGLVVPDLTAPFYIEFLRLFSTYLQQSGYHPLVALGGNDIAAEKAVLNEFAVKKPQAVVFFPQWQDSCVNAELALAAADPLLTIASVGACSSQPQLLLNYKKSAELATVHCFASGCQRVGLLLDSDTLASSDAITSGYRAAIDSSMHEYDATLVVDSRSCAQGAIGKLFDIGVDAIICQSVACARSVYRLAESRYLSIPSDISVVSLEDVTDYCVFSPELTTVAFDLPSLARLAVQQIIQPPSDSWADGLQSSPLFLPTLIERESVVKPVHCQSSRILIIGRLNMDINLKVPRSPQIGKPLDAQQITCLPGGKGGNQAVGVAKLGGSSCMIGLLGNDLYGKQIYEKMMHAGVDASGLSFDRSLPTGTAYINLLPDGNSIIVGNAGANELLNKNYIDANRALFKDASYCLLQMEMASETVAYILGLCHEHSINVIMKPSPASPFDFSILKRIHILLPNTEELNQLIPGDDTIEEKAVKLVCRGAQCVIVTLGENGCLWTDGSSVKHYPAQKLHCVDATGSSDTFISCLTVLLSEGKTMDIAVGAANYAAGLSVAFEGTQNSIPDRRLVDQWIAGQASSSLT